MGLELSMRSYFRETKFHHVIKFRSEVVELFSSDTVGIVCTEQLWFFLQSLLSAASDSGLLHCGVIITAFE